MDGFKGTPGPWAVGDSQLITGDLRYVNVTAAATTGEGRRNQPVCRVSKWSDGGRPTEAEGDGNARLIAAAPCLLAELVGLFELVDATDPPFVYDDYWAPQRMRIQAAIAKATGD